MMKERDNKYKRATFTHDDIEWSEYKILRNKVTSEIRKEKERYFNRVIDGNKNNSRQMWKNLKTLLPNNRKSAGNVVKFNDSETSDTRMIAIEFNRFFLESINVIATNIIKCNDDEHTLGKIDTKSIFDSFNTITLYELKKIVNNLKNTSEDEDGISTKILKDTFQIIGNRLLDVINESLSTGILPSEWKTSVIVPVPKVTNTILCEEYRPINTVPVYKKTLEIVVKDQLLQFCDKYSIIVPNQSGFRKGHSCETVIINICDIWLKTLDNDEYVVAVFLDFRRAFETVDRNMLLNKLEKLGIRDRALHWFKSYLDNRYQKVKFNSYLSDALETKYGVPQGTVIGPILFLLYVNDITMCVKECRVNIFADDTMIYITGKNIAEMIAKMNIELNVIFEWLCDNSLCVNINKCKYMIIGSRNKLKHINNVNFNVQINKNKLERVSEMKYLGIILDENVKKSLLP